MRKQEACMEYCRNYEVAVNLLNTWPTIHSTDELVAHIDQFQIIDLKSGGVVVFVLWRQVER